MEESRKVNEEFISKEIAQELLSQEARTEFDAVHPRFQTPKKEEIDEYQATHDHYCEQCKLFFAPNAEGTITHFRMAKHKPIGSCVYCDGPVYEYKFNKSRQIYHNCRDSGRK